MQRVLLARVQRGEGFVQRKFQLCYEHRLDRRRLLQVSALVLLGPYGTEAHGESSAGSVDEVRGDAFADAHGQHRLLDRASPIFVHDRVGTGPGSRLTARLGRDTTLRLGERIRLVIGRFLIDAGGEFTLQDGAMLFDRPAGRPPAKFQIRSPYGLIAVRGTRFFAGPSNGVFGIFVERGTVSVLAGGRRVTLGAGKGTNIARPGGMPTTPVSWGEARIRSALDSVQ